MIRALLIACGLLATTAADARQVLSNPSFASWPRGSPVHGSFGPGNETAANWVSKWGTSRASSAALYRAPFGMRYEMHPHGTETFYLRQTVGPLQPYLGHTYRMVVDAQGSPRVRFGFYINARWNHTQRVYIQNTVSYAPMFASRFRYETTFRMPTGAGISWRRDTSQGIEAAFLMTAKVPVSVNFHSVYIYQVK